MVSDNMILELVDGAIHAPARADLFAKLARRLPSGLVKLEKAKAKA